jgi:hypothetical protein
MSKRYRLAFLETICHSKNRHSYSSHRHTNGGTSLKRKHSSLKGSLRRSNKYINKIEEQQIQHDNKEAFIYQKCQHYGINGNLAKGDKCEVRNDCIPLDGIARVRSYKGGFNPHELIQAEKKHASKCAKTTNEEGYIHLQCTNLADIPPLCLVDEFCSRCNEKTPCPENSICNRERFCNGNKPSETFEIVANGSAFGKCNESSNTKYVVRSKNSYVDNSLNGGVALKHNKLSLNSDAIGEFV